MQTRNLSSPPPLFVSVPLIQIALTLAAVTVQLHSLSCPPASPNLTHLHSTLHSGHMKSDASFLCHHLILQHLCHFRTPQQVCAASLSTLTALNTRGNTRGEGISSLFSLNIVLSNLRPCPSGTVAGKMRLRKCDKSAFLLRISRNCSFFFIQTAHSSPLICQVSACLSQAQVPLQSQLAPLADTHILRVPPSEAARPQDRSLDLTGRPRPPVPVWYQVHYRRAGRSTGRVLFAPPGPRRSVLASLGAAGRPARARLEALGQPQLLARAESGTRTLAVGR